MKIDEKHLVQLAAVVEHGSVSKGALALAMTQPAVSRTLTQLEKRLGERLFEPGRKPLIPTPLGEALALHGQTIQAASRRASQELEGFQQGQTGVVRVGGTPYFMDGIISTMVADYQNHTPNVRVDQTYGYFSELREGLAAHRIDLAICPVDILEEESELSFTEVLSGRNVIACRNTHPLLKNKPASIEELQSFPWIAPPPGSPLHADLRDTLYALGAREIKIRYSGASLGAVLNYLQGTDALAVLPHSVVFAYRKRAAISALPNEIQQRHRALGLLRLRNGQHPPAVDNLVRHIEKSFDSLRHSIKRHERMVFAQE